MKAIIALTALSLGLGDQRTDEKLVGSIEMSRHTASESAVVCGVNALFVYLRCRGVGVDREAIRTHVREGAPGLTMQQMKSISCDAASPAIVVRASISDVDSSMLPVIGLTKSAVATQANHYIVVLSRQDDRLTFMDGTTGETQSVRQQWIVERELGAYLCPANHSAPSATRFDVALTIATIVGLLGVVLMCRKPLWRWAIACLAVGGFCSLVPGAQNARALDSSDGNGFSSSRGILEATQWTPEIGDFSRSPRHEAANIAALLLRLNDVSLDYESIWRMFYADGDPEVSLLDMKTFLARQGISCRLIRCTPENIDAAWLPAVTLMAAMDHPDTYGMSLLCMAGAKDCCVVSGGAAVARLMDGEEFRRSWSGTLLVLDPKTSTFGAIGLGALGTTLGVVAGCSLIGVRNFRRHPISKEATRDQK
jgi:hypothetical protein